MLLIPLVPHIIYFQLMFVVQTSLLGEYMLRAAPSALFLLLKVLLFRHSHPFSHSGNNREGRLLFSVGRSMMHSCCTDALLMGFRSSSERSDNGTMEHPALTILHL